MADLTTITNSPPPANAARLPALPAPELSVDYLARVKEIIEVLLGRRGSNWDRAVTFRDLQSSDLGSFMAAGVQVSATRAVYDPASNQVLPAPDGLVDYPEQIRQQLSTALVEVARARRADLSTVEQRLQSVEYSFASRLQETTAAVDRAAAGVRQYNAAYADDLQAVATQVTQLAAQLEAGGGGVEIEERLTAISDAVEGLQGQWSLKIQTNPTAGQPPVIAGIALSVEDPIAGPGTSSLVFMAEKFGFYTVNGTQLPFTIVGNKITFNGEVRINGNLVIGATGLQAGYEAPGTKNSDIKVGGRNLFPDGDFERGLHVIGGVVGATFAGPNAVVGAVRGTKSFFIEGSSADIYAYLGTRVPVKPGTEYRVSFYCRSATGGIITGTSSYLRLWNSNVLVDHTQLPMNNLGQNGDWVRQVIAFTCPGGVTHVEPRFGILTNGVYSWLAVDCMQIEEGNAATQWAPAPEDVDADIKTAKDAADAANAAITAISSDNVLSKGEKPAVSQAWSVIYNDRFGSGGVFAQANALSVDGADYGAKFGAIQDYLLALDFNNFGTDTPIDGPTFRTKFADYYTAKEALRSAIAAKIQANAAEAQGTANSAVTGLADKLSKTSASALAATVTLAVGGTLLAGTASNGVYMNGNGIYCVQADVVKVFIPISGDPTFAGKLMAAFGTFGAVSVAAGGSFGIGAASYNAAGVWFDYVGGVPRMSLVGTNGQYLTFDGAGLSYSGTIANQLSVAITNNVPSSKSNNSGATGSLGNLIAAVTGGIGTITLSWSITSVYSSPDSSNVSVYISSGDTGTSVSFTGRCPNDTKIMFRAQLIATDSRGISVTKSTFCQTQFGTAV